MKHALSDPVLFADFRTELLVGEETMEGEDTGVPEVQDGCSEGVQEPNDFSVESALKTTRAQYKDVGTYEDVKLLSRKRWIVADVKRVRTKK